MAVGFVLYTFVDQGIEQSADQQTADGVAASIARQFGAQGTVPELRTIEAALPNDQVIIVSRGTTIFTTPLPVGVSTRQLELTAVAPFPDGSVTVHDYTTLGTSPPLELIVVAAIPILLLVVTATTAASYLSRALRQQIEHARVAAERVAGGDLSARMALEGRAEFGPLAMAFNGMAERLEITDLNQRQFLGDLAHELATPVTAISGSGLAIADGTAATEEDRHEAAETLTRETRRLQELLGDLRRLTRLDLAQTVNVAPVAVHQLCREIGDRFAPAARAAGIELNVRGSDVHAVCDARLLDMIVSNFVSNAIRYTPAGGSVRIELRRHRQEVTIAVHDSGFGISAEHQARIFDRFYRVDEARQRATGGSGLGLSIATRAAKEMSGRIEVHSEPGTGSVFRITFPLNPSGTGLRAPLRPPLSVDDTALNQQPG
ncbi:MAG: HAMP domain-containing histidine kinase [Candidatus Dormibacteraeota bacterium]|uniref:histidine kinase n=1 Tax=Candidatus Aeolococcus gillhamiae TaxID=3127015 RepID=A0A934NBB1_9BACT|nr:HAMP domain-containing histidine kinase [Candidatus Dormibacteraeota bacterium]